MTRRSSSLLSVFLLACTPSISMSGFVLEAEDTTAQLDVVEVCAARELSCSAESLRYKVLSVHDDAGPDMVQSFDVLGCGKIGTFTRSYEAWFLVSVRDEATGVEETSACPDCPINCALPTIDTNGYDVEVEDTRASVEAVRRLAVGELACSEEELSIEVLSVHDDAGADMVEELKVSGCGRSAVYVRDPAKAVGRWAQEAVPPETEVAPAKEPAGEEPAAEGGVSGPPDTPPQSG